MDKRTGSRVSEAFNKGISCANGEIVGILNASDWYELDSVLTVARGFKQRPDIDVGVCPSISEAFRQTASEALACSTPVVAFKTSGLLDVVDDRETGYLATPLQSSDLAFGIHWVLKDISRWPNLSENARRKACTAFDINSVAKRYISLYEEVLRKGE